jgi:hypothetical protein
LGDFGKTGRAWVCGGEVGSSGGLLWTKRDILDSVKPGSLLISCLTIIFWRTNLPHGVICPEKAGILLGQIFKNEIRLEITAINAKIILTQSALVNRVTLSVPVSTRERFCIGCCIFV